MLGGDRLDSDFPVWEHRNRPYRYAIRPLIFDRGKYYWGHHSVERSGRVWVNITTNGALPADLPASNVKKVLSSNHQIAVEKNLEEKNLRNSKTSHRIR